MHKIVRVAFASSAAMVAALALPVASNAQSAPPQTWFLGQPYFRMDAGGAFTTDQRYRDANPGAPNAPLAPGDRIAGGVDPTGVLDLGFGARVMPYFRWDATLSYIPSMDFHGGDNFVPGSTANASIDSLVGMVNGYLDFAGFGYTFGGLQPYIDAGVGIARNHMDSMNTTTLGLVSGDSNTSFAWALGAGVAMPVGPRTMIDVSYRYLDLGDAQTGDTDAAGAISPLKAGLRTNLILAGLRFGF
jgi:opacity protein-like surface antigen